MGRLAENAVVLDDYEDCLVGTSDSGAAVYSINKMLARLTKDMSEFDAIEFLRYNTFGAACDEEHQWPIFVYLSE